MLRRLRCVPIFLLNNGVFDCSQNVVILLLYYEQFVEQFVPSNYVYFVAETDITHNTSVDSTFDSYVP